MKKLTLLQKARGVNRERDRYRVQAVTGEERQVAMAWAMGDLTLLQVSKAYNKKHGMGVYVMLARALRDYIQGIEAAANDVPDEKK